MRLMITIRPATLADATAVTAEFLFSDNQLRAYINGTLATIFENSDASFPNDEELRLTVEFLNGAAGAETCTINWLRLIHLRG